MQLQRKSACTGVSIGTAIPPCDPTSPLNIGPPAPASADLEIKLDLKGVIDVLGPAFGTGFLEIPMRLTLNDRVGGDMTVEDFPTSFPFDLIDGKAKLKTSANAFLNAIPSSGLPPCSSIEVVSISVFDENFNAFASPGIYLPYQPF